MKKAGSLTGSKDASLAGFTLIEVLFAILILSSGIIYIAPALFRSGGILAHIGYTYEAEIVANNLIDQQEEDLRKFYEINQSLSRGNVQRRGIVYSYEFEAKPQNRAGRLYFLTVRVQWRDLRQNEITRSAYILR